MKENSFSKSQTSLKIEKDEDKNSNNGTWMIASNTYPLYNNMEIDIFSNFLKINIYYFII